VYAPNLGYHSPVMKTSVERQAPTRLKLTIETAPDDVAPIWDDTLRRLSKEIKVPGFRKGKVPRPVLESRLGKENLRQEVLRDALPILYERATDEESISPVGQPEIEVTDFEEGDILTFSAIVDVRADLELPDYKGLEINSPSRSASETDIYNQLQRLRERYGTLEPVTRPSIKGDFLTVDMFASQLDVTIEGATAEDFSYEVGSGMFGPKMDEEVTGKRPGDILQFNAALPERLKEMGVQQEGDMSFKVVIKDVQAKKLPALDDEFAKTASEFDTFEELKASIAERIGRHKAKDADTAVQNLVLQTMIDKTEVPLPEAMVNKETELRLARFMRELERMGFELDQYLENSKLTKEELFETYRKTSEVTVAADLILEAVAKAEGMEVTEEDFEKEVKTLAEETRSDPEILAQAFRRPGAVNTLAGDILRRKALDFLIANAKINEEPANPTSDITESGAN
jgi:trigger factor